MLSYLTLTTAYTYSITSGTCPIPITTREDCAASDQLTGTANLGNPSEPAGCYVWTLPVPGYNYPDGESYFNAANSFTECSDALACTCKSDCDAGSFINSAKTACIGCSIGMYNDETGLSSCTSPTAYTYGLTSGTCPVWETVTESDDCAASDIRLWGGIYSSTVEPYGCYVWMTRTYFNSNEATTTQCTTINACTCITCSRVQTSCTSCSLGMYNDETGQSVCKSDCNAGSFINSAKTACNDYCGNVNAQQQNLGTCICAPQLNYSTISPTGPYISQLNGFNVEAITCTDKYCAPGVGCLDLALPACEYINGNIENQFELSVEYKSCSCGPTSICNFTAQYCSKNTDTCSKNSIKQCVNGRKADGDCICINAHNPPSNCKKNQFCHDDGKCTWDKCSSVDCSLSGRLDGVNYDNYCQSKNCDTTADWNECCQKCQNNDCSLAECPSNFECEQFYVRPSLDDIRDIPFDRVLFPYTGHCEEGCTNKECCIQKDSCSAKVCNPLDGYIVDTSTTRNMCNGIVCAQTECCSLQKCTCQNGTAALPPVCTENNNVLCSSCNDGFWLNGTICQQGSECRNTEYRISNADGTTDTKCKELTICNPYTEYVSTNSTINSNRKCSALAQCNYQLHYETPATIYSNRVCHNVQVCNSTFQYISTNATRTSNRKCDNKTFCNSGKYVSLNASEYNNNECSDISRDCNTSEYEHQPPTKYQNRVCREIRPECGDGEWQSKNVTATSNRECQNLTICDNSTQYEKKAYTNFTNRICSPLTMCSEFEFQSNQFTSGDRICEPLVSCEDGQYSAKPSSTMVNGKLLYTSNRDCKNCDFEGCHGCMNSDDCDFSATALAHNPSDCSNHICTFYSYNITNGNITFATRTGTLLPEVILKNNEWTRFDRNGTETVEFTAVHILKPSYQYFEISDGTEVSYKVNDVARPFKVQIDCKWEQFFESNCIGNMLTHECIDGKREGTKYNYWTLQNPALHGGRPCPLHNPYSEPCNNTQCDVNCVYTADSSWSVCTTGDKDTACGQEGLQSFNYYITTESKYDGTKCPTNKTRPCTGLLPTDNCDCFGHVLDGCGVCGGTCCPEGKRRDKCGVCGGDSTGCQLRLTGEKIQSEQKHVRSSTMRLFAPSFTFILLTLTFTGFCICLCK